LQNSYSLKNLLLVEDNPADARLVLEAFKESSHNLSIQIQVAQDGEEALEYLKKEKDFCYATTPDLVLLDLNLPKKNGIEVLQEIKEDENLKKIPVIVLSTSNNQDDINKAYQNHANCYLSKPLDFNEFQDLIKVVQDFWLLKVQKPQI